MIEQLYNNTKIINKDDINQVLITIKNMNKEKKRILQKKEYLA